MNVATRLMLEQMQKDIAELKQRVADSERTLNLLCAAVGDLQIAADQNHPARKTLTLPEKRKSA